jgi:Subtilisin-like serine proteases
MKKLFFFFLFSSFLMSGFSQEYGYLLVNITDAEKTIESNEKGQFVNKDKNLDKTFKDFRVFSYKYAFPKAKNEYLRKLVSIECDCDVKELAEFLKKNYSNSFSDFEYYQDSGYPDYDPSDVAWHLNDPDGSPMLWHLKNIEADKAWDITKGSSDVTIAIIDRGFDISHPDLENKVLSTIDSRTGDPFEYTDSYHGTFVASCAAAETDGGGYLASVGFNTMLRFYDFNTSAAVIAYHASFVDGVDVVSFSIADAVPATPIERLLVQEVLDNGTVIVRSAGNTQNSSDNSRFPFAHQVDSRIIIVSSTDKDDRHTNPSGETHANFPQVSICAPGYNILGTMRYNNGSDPNPYIIGNGTSYATPIVAGVCALLKSINKNLTPAQIKSIIQTTADPVADANLYPGGIGAGRINAYAAVTHAECPSVVNIIGNGPTPLAITSDTTMVSCGDINVRNVRVQSGAKLTLRAAGEVIIGSDFEVGLGSKLEIK